MGFQEWVSSDLTLFHKLGTGRKMHSRIQLVETIGASSSVLYQYDQVFTLVQRLMRHCDVFRPLMAFELLLVSENRQTLIESI